MTLDRLAELANELGLAGIEFPIDKYFRDPSDPALGLLLTALSKNGAVVRLDVETFSAEYLQRLIPVAAAFGHRFIRVKVADFYGGNRYKHPEFHEAFERFSESIGELLPTLARYQIRLLVENHQDIVLEDIEVLWRRFGREWIGINWDIGNSLPACETPLGFLHRAGTAIGNVHLKDYQLFACETGYRMVRCALGEGAMGLDAVIPALLKVAPEMPMTIELGALHARVADIDVPGYWEAMPCFSDQHISTFRSFVRGRSKTTGDWRTSWERRETRDVILQDEMEEIKRSVEYLRGAMGDVEAAAK